MRFKQLLPVAVALLTACQQAPVKDENSPLSRLPVGSRITLERELVVPEGHSRVFLQRGKVVAKTRLNQYRPHCNFEIQAVSTGESRIEPDTFTVTGFMEDDEAIVRRMRPQGNALRHVEFRAVDDNSMPLLLSRFVRYTLHSARQPGVMRLTCHGGFADPAELEAPGISDIRRALRGYATLSLHAAI